jgi:hypothetical protein
MGYQIHQEKDQIMPPPPEGGNPLSKIPKPVLLGGGAVIVGVGYIFYRKRKSAAAAAAAANSDNTSTQMGAASAGAYGNPLPGSGMLAPILLNIGGPTSTGSTDTSTTATSTTAATTTVPTTAQTPAPVPAMGVPPPIAAFLNGKAMLAGENIVQEIADPSGGWLALTNKGGVYTYGGAPFFGSYLGYAGQTPNPAAEEAGRGNFTQIIPHSDGSYTLIDQHGETYNFGPGTPKSAGGVF